MELLLLLTRSALFHPSSTSKGKKREAVTFPSYGKLREMEEWKCDKVLLLLVHFLLITCFLVRFRALWVVTKQPLPCLSNVLSVVTPGFHFPYRSTSETYCLKLHVISALYRLKEANLLDEQLTVDLGIVPDTSVSSIKLRFVKNLNLIFLLLTMSLNTVFWWNNYKFILKHHLLYLILIYERHTKQTDGFNRIFTDSSFCFTLTVRAFYVSIFSFFSVPFPYHVCHPLSISGSDKNMWL